MAFIYIGLWQAGSRLWKTSLSMVESAVRLGLELGLNRFDTAEIYGRGRSEKLLGTLAREDLDLYVVSKIAGFRWTSSSIIKASRRIRERIGRSVDLLLHHWPPPVYVGVCKVIRGLERTIDMGYADSIGLSNYPARLLEEAVHCTKKHDVKALQIQYSLAYRTPENKLIPLASRLGLEIMAWSPLAKGALTGEAKKSEPARKSDPVYREAARDTRLQEEIRSIAGKLGYTPAQVAVLWIKSKGVNPVVGVRKPVHVQQLGEIKNSTLPGWAVTRLDEASSKYIYRWGRCYKPLQRLRWIPGLLQYAGIRLIGGV